MKKKILIIHGANLNLAGTGSARAYGLDRLDEINTDIINSGKKMSLEIDTFHSNIEGEIINAIAEARGNYQGIIINGGAYAHYSYAIRDAIERVQLPCIEVQLSNIFAREEFRSRCVFTPVCIGLICGFGKQGYILALEAMITHLKGASR
jgi:3-dehydroquinate dehydratase-2